jgi:hypothetical protein
VIAATSAASLLMIGLGVPAGANSPNQDCGNTSPVASAMVGTEGNSGERVLALTASASA